MEIQIKKPIRYRAFFMTPGLISYEDTDQGIALVKKEMLDRALNTFIGMPVFNFEHKNFTPEEAFSFTAEQKDQWADGIVSATGFDDSTGWYFADILVWDNETQKNIDEKNYSCSCQMRPSKLDESGGVYNAIKYDYEILEMAYEHLAIVPKPRISESKIFRNSKGDENMDASKLPKILKLFTPRRNSEGAEEQEKKPEEEEKLVHVGDEQVPMKNLIEAYKGMKEKNEIGAGPEEQETQLSPETQIEMPDGSRVTLAQLIEAYTKNQSTEQQPIKKEQGDQGLNNSQQREKPNEHFKSVQNAANSSQEVRVQEYLSLHDRQKAARDKYSLKKE